MSRTGTKLIDAVPENVKAKLKSMMTKDTAAQRKFLQEFVHHHPQLSIVGVAARIALESGREQQMIEDFKSQMQKRPEATAQMLGPELTEQLKSL